MHCLRACAHANIAQNRDKNSRNNTSIYTGTSALADEGGRSVFLQLLSTQQEDGTLLVGKEEELQAIENQSSYLS